MLKRNSSDKFRSQIRRLRQLRFASSCPWTFDFFRQETTMICPNCKVEIQGASEQSQTIEILESQVRQLSQKLAFAGEPPLPTAPR
jgi:hypothetical protein